MKYIPLRKLGKSHRPFPTYAYVSDEDFDLVGQFDWKCIFSGKCFYAVREDRWMFMHRLIMHDFLRGKVSMVVHHLNGNGVDNRRDNLELMTRYKHTRMHRAVRKKKKRLVSLLKNGKGGKI